MLAGRDSAYAPSDAELDAAWTAGVRVWGVYFAGPNVLNGWSDADILRVKAKGFVVIAFCSGYADPAAMGARARALGILVCLDDESGMRPDGDWVEGWCATAGAGLYGNGSFHYNAQGIRPAAFHIFAGYYGYDPGATWPSFDVRPSTPCGWQWAGGHIEFGGNVDSAWYDDSLIPKFGTSSGSLSAIPIFRRQRLVNTATTFAVIGIGDDDGLYCDVWNPSANAWTGPKRIGNGLVMDFDVSTTGDRIDVVGRGMDRAAWHAHSNDGGFSWSTWEDLTGLYKSSLVMLSPAVALAAPAAPVDLSPVTQAANDAKAAAVAAQTAAQAAQVAAQSADSNAQAASAAIGTAAADIKAIRAKTDKDLS